MTTLREAAQAALDALSVTDYQTVGEFFSICADVRDNLRAALAEFDASLTDPTKISVHQTAEPAQPVAWRSWTGQCGYGYWESQTDADLHSDPDYRPVPLYTADAIREAVEAAHARMIADGWRQCAKGQRTTQFCGQLQKAVEAEREACLSACNKIATESKNYHAQGGAQACWYAIKARGGEA